MQKLWKKGDGECYEEAVKCYNCGGKHVGTSLECPTRTKQNEVAKVRAVQCISYTAAVKRVDGTKGTLEDSMVLASP